MVKKMVGLNPRKTGKLNPFSLELDKVSAAIKRDTGESTSAARALNEQCNQEKSTIVSKPTEQSI
jgi:hypothetical protein